MTSKKILTVKLIYAVVLPLIANIAVMIISDIYALVVFVAVGVLYVLPFAVNSYYIKNNAAEKKEDAPLKTYILTDLLFITLPSILSVVLCETVISFFDKDSGTGAVSVILCVVFILISVFNWIMYPIRKKTASFFNGIKKPEKKK